MTNGAGVRGKSRTFGADSNTWQRRPLDVIISLTQAFFSGAAACGLHRGDTRRWRYECRLGKCPARHIWLLQWPWLPERAFWLDTVFFSPFFFVTPSKRDCCLRFITSTFSTSHFSSDELMPASVSLRSCNARSIFRRKGTQRRA